MSMTNGRDNPIDGLVDEAIRRREGAGSNDVVGAGERPQAEQNDRQPHQENLGECCLQGHAASCLRLASDARTRERARAWS